MEKEKLRRIMGKKVRKNRRNGEANMIKNIMKNTVTVTFLMFLTMNTLFALDIQRDILQRAQQYAGTEYCHGGISPPCFDCSGFVLRIYGDYVPGMPRVSRDMAGFGQPIDRRQLEPGDLVFFATGARTDTVTHVAIYMGQDSIIHAISNGPNRGVTITPLSARYWERRFAAATRVLPRASQVASLRQDESIEFAQGTYFGELFNGEPHGHGEMAMRNGDRYRGEFREGLFEGNGVYTWANGDRYEGDFRAGEMHGAGRFVASTGRDVTGRWESGERVGGDVVAAADADTSRRTYIRAQDSPWETWDGVVEGDFRAWQQREQEAFEEYRRRSEPLRTR